MEQLRSQNKKLKQLHANCLEQLEKLKETGKSHEAQIDTLLKFNERLLGIIENEFNSATKSKISSDLHIITETNEASTDLNNHPHFKGRLAAIGKANGQAGNYEHNQMEGFEQGEEEEEEQIYNHQKQQKNRGQLAQAQPDSPKKQQAPTLPPKKPFVKLDSVFEQQQKGLEQSINLTNSIHRSNPSTVHQNNQQEPTVSLQQLKQMIKQYKQQFVDNSSEYQQICSIIHTDLLKDYDEFKSICKESQVCFRDKMTHVNQLKQEIKNFRPIQELINVMRRLNVPKGTEKLLHQAIISKHM